MIPSRGGYQGGAISPNTVSGFITGSEARALVLSDNAAVSSFTDLSGNGRHPVQASGTSQPIYKASGTNSKPAVRFDGSNDFLSVAVDMSVYSAVTIYIAFARLAAGTGAGIELTADPTAATNGLALNPWGTSSFVEGYLKGDVGANDGLTFPAPLINTPYVASCVFDRSAPARESLPFINSKTFPGYLADNNNATGAFANSTFYFGARGGASLWWNADWYGHGIFAGAHGGTLRSRLERYYAALGGATLPTSQVHLAFHGDSLTAGNGSTDAGTKAYHVVMIAALTTVPTSTAIGVGGTQISNMLTPALTDIDRQRDANRRNVLFMWFGSNDLAVGGRSTAQVIADYQTYGLARQAAGWQSLIFTLLPRSTGGTDVNFEVNRQTVNTSIRANYAAWGYAGVVDVGADATIGAPGASANGTYYTDGTHMTDAGYAIAATIARTALAAIGVP